MSVVVAISATQPFAYNQSPDPWSGPRDFREYSDDDNKSIISAVNRVCCAEQQFALAYVLKIYGGFYCVAAVRTTDLRVNVVQFRVDFSPDGKYEVRERPVSIPDQTKREYPHLEFISIRLSDSALAALFWDPLRAESRVRCDSMLLKDPSRVPFLPGVFYYSGPNCFTVTAYQARNKRWFHDDDFRSMLSVVLLEAAVRPSKQFACVLLYDGDQGINRRKYVGVLREGGGSRDIIVVCLDAYMRQHKVVFYTGNPPVPVAEIPEIPGFNLVSRRLTGEEKDKLMQEPVFMHWTRPNNRIVPVGSSLGLFADPACIFQYNRNINPVGARDIVPFDEFASGMIREGLALVCHSGGPRELLVPLRANLPPIGEGLFFSVISREFLHVTVVYAELFSGYGYCTLIPQGFKDTLPHMLFSVTSIVPIELLQSLVYDVLRSVWTRRIDQVVDEVVRRQQIAVTGVKFQYLVTRPSRGAARVVDGNGHVRGAKSLPSIAAERVERVIRAMSADVGIGSLLVPVSEVGLNAFVAVVRDGVTVTVGYISALDANCLIQPLRSLQLDLPNLVYLPFIYQLPMAPNPAITRDLFEQPLFSHWQRVAEINPHNWSPRAAAFGLAAHPRVGARSPMRVLDAELMAMVARLCLQ